MQENVLQMENITKAFPGVLALNNVSFMLKKGEVHSLVGENGAGKSTLMKVLGGVHMPDEGVIRIKGQNAKITCPSDAIDMKIGIIYQEFNLVQSMSVYENLYLGKELKGNALGTLDRKEMLKNAVKTMEKLGLSDFDCSQKVNCLSVAMQQMVEIGKAVFNDIDVLVMDEPTAVLTDNESTKLFRVIENLREKGVSIIYISHRLEEVIELSDIITVLRDGQIVETVDNIGRNVQKDYLVSRMVGRDLDDYYPEKQDLRQAEVALKVEGLKHQGVFENIDFEVKKGEILGFAGLVGAGRSEIMKGIFGAMRLDSGDVYVGPKKVRIKSPLDAIDNKIALVPEDRKHEGLVLDMSLADNMSLTVLKDLSNMNNMDYKRKQKMVDRYFDEFQIRPKAPKRKASNFSGGNQQKAVIAKWLAINPEVIILDEPTRGIDIGAKLEIYTMIADLAKTGVGIVVVSSELSELIGICDRIMVVSHGRISGEFERNEFEQDTIMAAAHKII